jgi:hypothetical protein
MGEGLDHEYVALAYIFKDLDKEIIVGEALNL